MILVDSSVWIDYFRNAESKAAKKLHETMLANGDIAIVPVILTEVLMGFREDRAFRSARHVLLKVPQLPVTNDTHIRAAVLFRSLQKRGITVRGAIDCIIAQTCLETSSELITLDTDFSAIAKVTALKVTLC